MTNTRVVITVNEWHRLFRAIPHWLSTPREELDLDQFGFKFVELKFVERSNKDYEPPQYEITDPKKYLLFQIRYPL